jgi:hypothetical protein
MRAFFPLGALLPALLAAAHAAAEDPAGAESTVVSPSSVRGKILCGYQSRSSHEGA